jgi:sulfopyruvate decarboxylase TPP-binding subunit
MVRRKKVHGIDLGYLIIGEGKRILVLETEIGNSFYSWLPFIDTIKIDYTIILYHQAGYSKSTTSIHQRTTANIARELMKSS